MSKCIVKTKGTDQIIYKTDGDYDVSDGYHTFKELYEYRMLLQAGWFNELWNSFKGQRYDVHKSWLHSDGKLPFEKENYFVVVAELPTGQITNHYDGEFWDLFKIDEKHTANKWDGHTPAEAAKRMKKYILGQF